MKGGGLFGQFEGGQVADRGICLLCCIHFDKGTTDDFLL